DDPLVEQPRVDVELALPPSRSLDDHWDQRHVPTLSVRWSLTGTPRRRVLSVQPNTPACAKPVLLGRPDADIMATAVFLLTHPNVLTVLRIMLVPVLVVALLGNSPAGYVLAAIVFALASLTDFVDGYLARARAEITTFGKLMDPLA